MKITKSFFAGLVAAMLMVGVPTAALAQQPVILFIDQGKLLSTSAAGKSINSQVQALAKTAESELESERKTIQAEGEQLQKIQESLSKEDFAKRYQALVVKAQEGARLEQIKKAEIAQAQAQALAQLNEELRPVVEQILDKKKATVLLERSAVVFADEKMDITDEIVAALDKKVKTVKVTKPDLLAQAKAAQAARQ
jgi:outer membrane protein